ncbi:hypothetical protein SAMN05421780_108139 [Flexibacter flexilis DSM 6793]|uniref:Uncharacterized protein n=1 Tax=Flexibacter flexilis DSM 6793 TaxID=927664 RepID=A0A1I1LG79_9BACT|nr:hypothetical protein SAMN05421780_108139 [Flexibacter flexilis DSM 6793]
MILSRQEYFLSVIFLCKIQELDTTSYFTVLPHLAVK